MRKTTLLISAAAAMLAPAWRRRPGASGPSPLGDPPPPTQLDELTVTGERTGPGHVARPSRRSRSCGSWAASRRSPKGITWRSKQVEQVLATTQRVLVPKPLEIGIVRILWLLDHRAQCDHDPRRQAAEGCPAAESLSAVRRPARPLHEGCRQMGALSAHRRRGVSCSRRPSTRSDCPRGSIWERPCARSRRSRTCPSRR